MTRNDFETVVGALEGLFHPASVALVGVPQGMKAGKMFLLALEDMGFKGAIHLVHPTAREIDGRPCHPAVSAIPGPVDLAIVLVPARDLLSVARECAAKGMKGAVIFTSGGRELGTEAGLALERSLSELARDTGMRIIGPNGMGLFSSASGLSFFPGMVREPGGLGIISHSGSLTNILGRLAAEKGMAFSKMASLGNECDVRAAHLMAYLGRDPKTRVIGAYLEEIKDGPAFLRELKAAGQNKPVVLWKMGLTGEGRRASTAHTGALAGSAEVWNGVVRQGGGVPVFGWDEWVDTLNAFYHLPQPVPGNRMAIISGPGGLCVSASEAAGRNGLRLADLTQETRKALSAFIPPTGTSLSNPVDVSLSASLVIDIYLEAARAVAKDPGVDAVAVAGGGFTDDENQKYTQGLIDIQKASGKPFLIVLLPGFDLRFARQFGQAGLPCFASSEAAMLAYARVAAYWTRRAGR